MVTSRGNSDNNVSLTLAGAGGGGGSGVGGGGGRGGVSGAGWDDGGRKRGDVAIICS